MTASTPEVASDVPVCSTACDPDCDAVCHESHVAGHKKAHWPYDCPAADEYLWGESPFTGFAIKRLRGERDEARVQLAAANAECARAIDRADRLDSSLDAMRQQAVEAVKERNAANERAETAGARLASRAELDAAVKPLNDHMKKLRAAGDKQAAEFTDALIAENCDLRTEVEELRAEAADPFNRDQLPMTVARLHRQYGEALDDVKAERDELLDANALLRVDVANAHPDREALVDDAIAAHEENDQLRAWLDELGYDTPSVQQRLRGDEVRDGAGWNTEENAEWESRHGSEAAAKLRVANDRAWAIVKELRETAVAEGRDPYRDPMAQRLSAALVGVGPDGICELPHQSGNEEDACDRRYARGGVVSADAFPILAGEQYMSVCTFPMPSRADVEGRAGRLQFHRRTPEEVATATAPGGQFWADLNRRLRDEPKFRNGYVETSAQIQALDDAANGDGPFRNSLRDELIAAGMAAGEQWLSARANRRMSDVNKKRLVGHIVNALWERIEQAAIEMAEHIADPHATTAPDQPGATAEGPTKAHPTEGETHDQI